jgi:hypothetical protein
VLCSTFAAAIVVVFTHGSQQVTNIFFNDIGDLLERKGTVAALLVVVGNLNVQTDGVVNLEDGCKLIEVAALCGLTQHVTAPMHRSSHNYALMVTRNGLSVSLQSMNSPRTV